MANYIEISKIENVIDELQREGGIFPKYWEYSEIMGIFVTKLARKIRVKKKFTFMLKIL